MGPETASPEKMKVRPTANFYDLKGKPPGLKVGETATITIKGKVTNIGMNKSEGSEETYRCELSDVEIEGGESEHKKSSMGDQMKKIKPKHAYEEDEG